MSFHRMSVNVLVVVACLGFATVAMAARPTDELFPVSTKAFASIPDTDRLHKQFDRAPLGRLLADPLMKPFADDLKTQMHDKGAELKNAIGVSLKDLDGLATGEVGLGIVKNQQEQASFAAVLDVADNLKGAQELIQRVDAFLIQQRNAKRSNLTHRGVALQIYDVPPAKPTETATQGVYFFMEGQLGIASDIAVAQEIIDIAAGAIKENLASVPAYQACLKRATSSMDLAHDLAFWIEPIGLAETAQKSQAKPSKKAAHALKIAKSEGFDAYQGIGGKINFAVANYGILYRVAVYAPQPFRRAMKMLSLPNGVDTTPQPWVSREIGGYTTFNLDPLNAFDNFGTLFDSLFGEGESVWPDVLDSLKNDENGPQVDLRNDVVAHLGKRISAVTDNAKPIGPHSQRRLFAAESINPKKLSEAIDRLMRNDSSVVPHDVNGIKIYEIIPEAPDELPELNINNVQQAKKNQVPPPHGGVAVAHGHLLISSHYEFIQQVVATPQAANPLAGNRDYQKILSTFQQLAPKMPTSIQGFVDDSDMYITTYEMFRQGKLADSTVPLAKMLNSLLNESGIEGSKQWKQIDGTKLPPFAKISHYGGVGGTGVSTEDNGWFVVGFILDGQAPQAEAARREAR